MTHPPREPPKRRIAEFCKGYGPTFTLISVTISVIVTSYWSYKALDLSASTSRAELYVRNVELVVKPGNSTSEAGALIINAGQKAAHLLKHHLTFTVGKIDGPSPVIDMSNTEIVEETIDHDHPLTFTLGIPPEAIPPLPPNSTLNSNTIYEGWMMRRQRLFIVGKMQYEDGVGVRVTDWCKYLGAGGQWTTCPPRRER